MIRKARTFTWYEAANILGTTQQAVVALLRHRGEILPGSPPLPKDEHVRAGLFVIEPGTVLINNEIRKSYRAARVTVQGLAWLEKELDRPAAA